MNRLTFFIFAALLLAPLASLHAAGLTHLRCEYRENPLGIDVAKPRLSWVIEDRGQNAGRGLANSEKTGEPSGARSMAYGHPEGASGGEHQPVTGMAAGTSLFLKNEKSVISIL